MVSSRQSITRYFVLPEPIEASSPALVSTRAVAWIHIMSSANMADSAATSAWIMASRRARSLARTMSSTVIGILLLFVVFDDLDAEGAQPADLALEHVADPHPGAGA